VLNYVFVMNVAMIQPRNGYRQFLLSCIGYIFGAKLTRPRPGRGQMLEAEANLSRPRPRLRPKFWPRGQYGLETFTSPALSSLGTEVGLRFFFRFSLPKVDQLLLVTHPILQKFHRNSHTTFSVILLTDRQTNDKL